MKHPAPRAKSTAAFHFTAARDGRLMLPWCEACAKHHWPLQARCPHCRGDTEPAWREAHGGGRIESFSAITRAVNPELEDEVPYVVAFIELDEGVRLFSNIVDAPPEALRCGQRVQCRFEATADPDLWVPVFALAEQI